MNSRLPWLSILPDLKWLMALFCFPTGASWLQGHQRTYRNSWASCKNAHTLTHKKSLENSYKNRYTQYTSGTLSLCLLFTGWRGTSRTTRRGRRQGRQSRWLSKCFSPWNLLSKPWRETKRMKHLSELEWGLWSWLRIHWRPFGYLLQGSRGIQGPQGAVGKKGENVSEHTFVCALHSCGGVQRVCQMMPTDSSACFFRVCRVLMEKMAHLVFLESR